jgi:hypothetical protein
VRKPIAIPLLTDPVIQTLTNEAGIPAYTAYCRVLAHLRYVQRKVLRADICPAIASKCVLRTLVKMGLLCEAGRYIFYPGTGTILKNTNFTRKKNVTNDLGVKNQNRAKKKFYAQEQHNEPVRRKIENEHDAATKKNYAQTKHYQTFGRKMQNSFGMYIRTYYTNTLTNTEVLTNTRELELVFCKSKQSRRSWIITAEKKKRCTMFAGQPKTKMRNATAPTLLTQCEAIYNKWMDGRGTPAMFTVAGRKAMKNIITYLCGVVEAKTPNLQPLEFEHQVLRSWQAILDRHHQWGRYEQTKLRLIDIASNMTNIVNAIRNGNTATTQYQPSVTNNSTAKTSIVTTIQALRQVEW